MSKTIDAMPVATDESQLDDTALLTGACPNCGAAGEDVDNSWCRKCGYYGKLGAVVELDHEWEGDCEGEESEDGSLPPWVYHLGAAWIATLVFSFVARLALGRFPTLHMVVGLSQLLVGLGVFLSLHFICFLDRSLGDGGAKLMDLLSPFTIWGPVFRDLPQREKRLLSGWTGLWAGVFAIAITGGIPASWLEFKETAYAKEKEPEKKGGGPAAAAGTGDLTGAIEEFAEQGTEMVNMPGEGVGQGPAGTDVMETIEEEEEEEQWMEMECVIVGYLPAIVPTGTTVDAADQPPQQPETDSADETNASGEDGDQPSPAGAADTADAAVEVPAIRALVVASEVHRRLCVVGYVSEGVTKQVADELIGKLSAHLQDAPFVPCSVEHGVWVQPKLICRILYKKWDPQAGLVEPKFDAILQEL